MLRVGLTLLLLAGADGDGSPEYQAQQDVARLGLPEQAADWTPAEVQLWAADQRFPAASLAQLKDLDVDGDILLHVELGDIKDDLHVTNFVEGERIFRLLSALRELNHGLGKDEHPGLTFWQQRALNRRAMDGMVLAIGFAPRTAMGYFGRFPKHAQPTERIASGLLGWVEWIFVPEWFLWRHADTLMGGLPGLVPISLAVTLVAKAGLLAMACASVAGWGRWADQYAFGGGGGGGGGELPRHVSSGLPPLPPPAGLGATTGIDDGDVGVPHLSADSHSAHSHITHSQPQRTGANDGHLQLGPAVHMGPGPELRLMETVFGVTAIVFVVGASMLVSELGGLVVSWIYWYVYPAVPWFVADAIFYFGVYASPLLSVTKTGNDVKKSKQD